MIRCQKEELSPLTLRALNSFWIQGSFSCRFYLCFALAQSAFNFAHKLKSRQNMEYLSSFAIYQEVIDGMDAMGITKEEFAENLHMSVDELDEFLTPIRDYTISEIQNLMGALYLDVKIEVVPE